MPTTREQLIGTPADYSMSQGEFLSYLDTLVPQVRARDLPGVEEDDSDFAPFLTMALSRYLEAASPERTYPIREEPMSLSERVAIQNYEATRAESLTNKVIQAIGARRTLRALQQQNPEAMRAIGVDDSYFDRLKQQAAKAGSKGWRALDIILRNLDRGRGAIAEYQKSIYSGATPDDALRRAKSTFLGSEKGWTWVPQTLGPSYKEVLIAAGWEPSPETTFAGFASDVIIDPINILGTGASRKGIEIGAHQILNSAGREAWGTVLRTSLDNAARAAGVASELELPVGAIRVAQDTARAQMRAIVNSSRGTASQYLDIGGLKIAGYTLPGTSYLRRARSLRDGKIEDDWVSKSLVSILGNGTLRKVDQLGDFLSDRARGPLSRRLATFVDTLPDNIRQTGRAVGLAFNRTNPQAGEEYRWLKEAEYYDLLAFEEQRVHDLVDNIFTGVNSSELEGLTLAIEGQRSNPQSLPAFLADIAARYSPAYATRVQDAAARYAKALDISLLEEVDRGFFPRGLTSGATAWGAQKKQMFKDWVAGTLPDSALPPKIVTEFNQVRRRNYVPHIYLNVNKYRKLSTVSHKARPPSIVEPFTHRRFVDTLEEARELGLNPEYNIKKLLGVRLIAARRAAVTQDFLTSIAEKQGIEFRDQLAISISEPHPESAWQAVLKARTDADGRVALPIDKQIALGREMGKEALVPADAVARLADAARREFLLVRFRTAPSFRKASQIWERYVVNPTRKGLYDGLAIAPGRTVGEALTAAKELSDDFYPRWGFLHVGGDLVDPRVLGKVMLPIPIIEDLERLRTNMLPDEMRTMLTLYDKLNYWWKRSVTVPFPSFHVRNKISNLTNSALDIGLLGILDRSTMWSIMQGADGTLHTTGGAYTYSQIRQAMRRLGVLNVQYRRHDVGQLFGDMLREESLLTHRISKRLGLPLPGRKALAERGELTGPQSISFPFTPGTLFQAGSEVGLIIENADRAQLFIKSLQRGMTLDQAARRVKQFLFDYQDIGAVESQLIRRFFNPFWTWTRKNLSLQARSLGRTPGRWVAPAKLARSFSAEPDRDGMRSDVERLLLPSYLSDTFSIRLDTSEKWSKWLLNPDLPASDLNRLWQGDVRSTLRDWLASVGPFAREIMEEAAGVDFYRGKDRVEFIRGTRVYGLLAAAPKPLQDYLHLHRTYYRDQEIIRVDPRRWRALQWSTGWLLNRFYTTIGRVTDPQGGTLYNRLFNFLTGMRIDYIRPDEQARAMLEESLLHEDKGLFTNLRSAVMRAYDQIRTENLERRAVVDEAAETRKAIETPEYEIELEDTPGASTWSEED